MPVFAYKGLDTRGKEVRGLLDAESPRSLRAQLKKDGIRIIHHEEESPGAKTQAKKQSPGSLGNLAQAEFKFGSLFERTSASEVALVTRQLATLQKSGITLIEALTAIVEQLENEKLKSTFGAIKSAVNEGSSLADAMAKHPSVFGTLYVSMIRAGEASGALDLVLMRLAGFLEAQARLSSRIMNAMLYPAIMVGVGGIIMTVLFVVVIPRITKIFDQVRAELPLQTKILIFIADIFKTWWWSFPFLFGLAVYLFQRWKRSPKGRPVWDRLTLRAPVAGPVVRMVAVSRFSRTLATLLRSGVPVLTALDIVKDVLDNHRLATVITDARDAIREGEPFATPLKRSREFPPLVVHMIAIGEASGQLEEMLENIAENYEFQVDQRVESLTTLIEPFMIVGMGLGVAYVVFAILMPILQLSQHVR